MNALFGFETAEQKFETAEQKAVARPTAVTLELARAWLKEAAQYVPAARVRLKHGF